MTRSIQHFYFPLALLMAAGLLLAAAPRTRAATITAQLDTSPVTAGQSFQLIYSVGGSADGEPDFSPIQKNFQILGRSQSTQMQLINGNFSHKTQWTLTLMATRAGTFTIPPIHFGSDVSPQVQIKVLAAGANTGTTGGNAQAGNGAPATANGGKNLFMEVQARPKDPYVQGQVIYTVRLYRSVQLGNATLTEPSVNGANAVVKKLGDDNTYNTWHNGQQYTVTERHYAVFPQKSGHLTIQPLVFQGQVIQGAASFFDPFGQNVRTVRLQSDPVELNVRPIPAAFSGSQWLPAHQVTLSEQWPKNPPTFQVGEPVTLTLTLQADGLTAAQLPPLAPHLPDTLRQYPDQPALKDQTTPGGVIGTRTEKIALVPTQSGTVTLPAINVPWWDINTGKEMTAELPAQVIHVLAAEGGAAAPTQVPSPAPAPVTTPARPVSRATPIATPAVTRNTGVWPLVSLVLALGWVLTLGGWWWTHRRRRHQPARTPVPEKTVNATRQLRRACESNDAIQAKTALLRWAAERWPGDPPTSLGELARRVDDPLKQAVQTLDRVLYGPEKSTWRGSELWRALQQFGPRQPGKPRPKTDTLAPLHP